MKVEKRHVESGSKNEISLVLTITPRSFGKFGQAVHLLDRKGNELFSLGIEGQALEPIAIDEIDRSACEAGKTFKAEVSSNFGHDLRGAKVKTAAMSPFEVDLITGDNGRFYLVGRCKDPLHAFPADGGSFEVDVKFQSGDELTSYLRVKRRLEEMILPNRLRSTTDEQSVVIVTSKSQMPDYGENIAIFDAAGTEIGAGTFSKRRSNVIYYKLKLHQERTNPTSNLVVSLSTTIGWENVGFVSVE
ncbi:MAG: hypothetical protein MUC83_13160 [Pirellula sp.]|jgi:hypothetical protein|nr:hypothetical protein [Pirellula sp.]